METLTSALPFLGAALLAAGLVALARGMPPRAVLGASLSGLAGLAAHGVRESDVLLCVGLVLAGLALVLAVAGQHLPHTQERGGRLSRDDIAPTRRP